MTALDFVVSLCSRPWPEGLSVPPDFIVPVANEAARQRVAVWILSRIAEQNCSEHWASDLASHLRPVRMAALRRNLVLRDSFCRVATTLSQADVNTVALKGVDLMLNLYPALEFRPAGDIDILVSPPDASKAFELLSALPDAHPLHEQCSASATEAFAPHYAPLAIGDTVLELHFSLFGGASPYNPNLSTDELKAHLVRRSCTGVAYFSPDSELSLYHLSAHAVKNRHNIGLSVGWLLDIALLFDRNADRLLQLLDSVMSWNPTLVNPMTKVWLLAANLSLPASRNTLLSCLGRSCLRLDARALRRQGLAVWTLWKLRRAAALLAQSCRFLFGSAAPHGMPLSRRFSEALSFLKSRIIQSK